MVVSHARDPLIVKGGTLPLIVNQTVDGALLSLQVEHVDSAFVRSQEGFEVA